MLTFFLNYIKDKKISIIVYCIAAAALVWMYVAMYPSILEQAADFQKAFSSYPTELFTALGVETLSFDTIENFLAMENYSIMWPIMMMFLSISLAGYGLVREVEKGTAEIILSRPVSRLSIFFSRYLAGLVALIIFTAVSVYSIIPFGKIYNIEYNLSHHNNIFILSVLFMFAIYSLAMMLSAIFSEKGKVYGAMGGILVLMYAINIFASLKDSLENLHYASFFYYYKFNDALIDGVLSTESVLIFLIAGVVATAIGAWWFNKRDIAV
ncbi:MAG: ABC transporter permease subunit [Patescibacteria group bacterium]